MSVNFLTPRPVAGHLIDAGSVFALLADPGEGSSAAEAAGLPAGGDVGVEGSALGLELSRAVLHQIAMLTIPSSAPSSTTGTCRN